MQKIPVIVDTREKAAWSFSPDEFDVTHSALWAGDYALKVDRPVIAIERKTLGDFVQTVVRDWIRFRKELYRLAHFDTAIIAVECNLEQIINHQYESEAVPDSILGRAEACLLDHGIPVLFWGDSAYASRMAARTLRLAWKRYAGEAAG